MWIFLISNAYMVMLYCFKFLLCPFLNFILAIVIYHYHLLLMPLLHYSWLDLMIVGWLIDISIGYQNFSVIYASFQNLWVKNHLVKLKLHLHRIFSLSQYLVLNDDMSHYFCQWKVYKFVHENKEII